MRLERWPFQVCTDGYPSGFLDLSFQTTDGVAKDNIEAQRDFPLILDKYLNPLRGERCQGSQTSPEA